MSGWGNDDDASGGGGEKKKGCFKCGEEGHMSRDCPTGGGGGDGGACRKCGEEGHFAKDCSLPDKCFKCKKEGHKSAECELPDTCFKCKKEGHMAADCELPDTCRKCKKEGHMARDCELPDVCRNCGEEGHMSKDCTKPQMCKRCGEEGHMVRECTQEEKTRQMTDEEGKIREIYVPKEEDDSKLFESAITLGINFSKFDSIPAYFPGELPPELAITILSHLDATDLCMAACVWPQLATDNILWHSLCRSTYKMEQEKLLKSIKSNLKGLVLSEKNGYTEKKLWGHYMEFIGKDLERESMKLGFSCMAAFLDSCRDIITRGFNQDGEQVYKGIADESTQHMAELIGKTPLHGREKEAGAAGGLDEAGAAGVFDEAGATGGFDDVYLYVFRDANKWVVNCALTDEAGAAGGFDEDSDGDSMPNLE